MKKSWKQAKIHDMELLYGGCIEDFKGYEDDRMVYINTYNQIMEALISLPEEPARYIKVALWKQINEDKKVMNRIQGVFCD